MKLSSALTLLALAAAPTLSSAANQFVIDFEQNWPYGTAVDNTYGAASFTNLVAFSNDAYFTYYSGAPSSQGVAMGQLPVDDTTGALIGNVFMNVAAGVDGVLEFYYSSPVSITGAVKAYSGANGTGSLLGSFDLVANALNVNGDGLPVYDTWTKVSFSFSGTALSFDFTPTANALGLDNIAAVPEPSSFALAGVALAVVGSLARRRKA